MTTDQVLLLGGGIFALMIVVIFFSVVWDLKKNKKKYDAEHEEYIEKTFSEEAEVEAFHAEIVDMVCGTGMVGSYRLPKAQKTFLVNFKAENGEMREICVSEDVYLSLEIGMSGMLTIVEGNLDSFELENK
jgi:hypothetical protein